MPRRSFVMRSAMALILVAATVGGVGTARTAVAYPRPQDVAKAQEAVRRSAAGVASIQARLDVSEATLDAADTALSVAAEDYDDARIALATAVAQAVAAKAASDIASRRLDEARLDVGRIAASAYRDGGRTSTLEAVLSARGPQEVLDRASAVRGVAERQQKVLKQVDARRAVATTMQRDAGTAVLRQTAAAETVRRAQAAAQRQADAARSTFTAQQQVRATLITQLAAAQRTSVAVAEARRAGLEEERRRAERAAALERARQAALRAAAERAAANARAAVAARSQSRSSRASIELSPPAQADDDGAADGGSSQGSAADGRRAVAWARTKIGLPYLWGGDGPGSYDCSGLTLRAWEQQGVYLPHSSRLQYSQYRKVSYDDLRPGDLIFYATDTSRMSTIHHVVMYAGGDMIVEAPATGLDVRLVPMRWRGAMPFATRP